MVGSEIDDKIVALSYAFQKLADATTAVITAEHCDTFGASPLHIKHRDWAAAEVVKALKEALGNGTDTRSQTPSY